MVIKSIKCKETERIFDMETSHKLPGEIHQRAYDKLRMLNNAATLIDLQIPPSNNLEKLSGKRSGQHSIRINNKWRICFKWKNNDAHDVEIVDYH
jgi:proteic killer suppression protein